MSFVKQLACRILKFKALETIHSVSTFDVTKPRTKSQFMNMILTKFRYWQVLYFKQKKKKPYILYFASFHEVSNFF